MGETAFELDVAIRAIDYFTGPLRGMMSQAQSAEGSMKRITDSMRLMGSSTAEINNITSALNRMGDQKAFSNVARDLETIGMARSDIAAMEQSYMRMAQYNRDIAAAQSRYAAGKDLAASGTGNLMTAAIGGFGIFEMVKKAGEFQSNMATIQDTTGATNKQMDTFSNAIMNASSQVSKFNDFQMAQIGQTLTSGGFNNLKQAQALLLPVAKFAEVQGYENKQSDPIEATKQAIEMAHVFKNYDPKSFESFLNTFNKYSMMQPGSSSQLQQTLTYLAPTALTMGMKPNDIMALSAVANRVGLTGSHGGTNAADMILRLIPGLVGGGPTPIKNSKGKITGYKTPKAWQAMEDLGFIDSKGNSKFFNKDGSIKDLNGMLTTMVEDSKKMNPMQLQQKYHDIFGIQGGRAAAILGNKTTIEQVSGMRKQLSQTKDLDKIHTDHQNTAAGQMNLLKSNSMTLMLRVGQQLAISLNPALKSINSFLSKMLSFSQSHPQVAKIIGDFALLAVGGKAAEGVLKILMGNFKMLSAAVRMLRITSAAGELTRFGKIVGGMKNTFALATTGVKMYASSFAGFARTVGRFSGKAAMAGIKGIGTAMKAMGSGALTAIKWLGRMGLALAKLGIQAARWAIGVAADWLIAMGPVGWIIAGVTAVIALGVAAWMSNFFGFRDKMTALWNWIKGHWKMMLLAAINPFPLIIMGVLNLLPNKFKQSGIDMINGLINGIKGMAGKVVGVVKGIAGGISSAFKSMLGIHSPSKVFAEHGKWIVAGVSQGIDQNSHMATQSTNRLATGINNSFNPKLQTGSRQPIATANTGGTINIQPGAIVIHGENSNSQEIAQEVLRQLGKVTRGNMLNAGISVNMGAF